MTLKIDNGVCIIAELSANHNQKIETALTLIEEAAKAGADAVKLQTYTADTITLKCYSDDFRIKKGLWENEYLYDLYQRAYTPWEWFPILQEKAHSLNLEIFSSPFDESAVDFLESHNCPIYKVASCEVTDHILLKKIAETKKPVIISSGCASLDDIESALHVLKSNGTTDIVLLKCTSAYPAEIKDSNLKTMVNMKETFGVPVGLSDHTLGSVVPIASVVLGATVIEKHFTLSRSSGSPDDEFSLTPQEFKQMVKDVRNAEVCIGNVTYGGVKSEEVSKSFRRSLFVSQDIKKGQTFTKDNVRSVRPGNGLHTKYFDDIIGKVSKYDLTMGTPMSFNLIV